MRTGHSAADVVIVHSYHGNLSGNGYLEGVAAFKEDIGLGVVAGHNPHRFWKGQEPVSQFCFVITPEGVRAYPHALLKIVLEALGGKVVHESLTAAVAPDHSVVPEEGEIAVSAGNEAGGHHFPRPVVVCGKAGDLTEGADMVHRNGHNAVFTEFLHAVIGVERGQDYICAPLMGPGKEVFKTVGFPVGGRHCAHHPGFIGLLLGILTDSAQYPVRKLLGKIAHKDKPHLAFSIRRALMSFQS